MKRYLLALIFASFSTLLISQEEAHKDQGDPDTIEKQRALDVNLSNRMLLEKGTALNENCTANGEVVLYIVVNEDGSVSDVRIVQSNIADHKQLSYVKLFVRGFKYEPSSEVSKGKIKVVFE